MELFPEEAEVEVEKPSVMSVVIVPVSLLLNTKLGVVSLPGVATAVTAASEGAVESYVQINCQEAELLFP